MANTAPTGDLLDLGYAIVQCTMPRGGHDERTEEAFESVCAGSPAGSRRISPDHRLVRELLNRDGVTALFPHIAEAQTKPVRAIAFDKTAGRNWSVPWHQDRTIAVDRRDNRAEVGNWTVKNGVPHCEPPVELLEGMLTLRWHLDAVGPRDGCIRVLPGSHRMGRLVAADISRLLETVQAVDVPVPAGAVFVMSPLLVHSSRKRVTQGRRRVLHVELAAEDPPSPLRWTWA